MKAFLGGLLAGVVAVCGCGSEAVSAPGQGATGCSVVSSGSGPRGNLALRAEKWVTGLEVPWSLAFLPGGADTALVTERSGRVRLVRQGQLVPAPVLELPVVNEGEGGLLGIALHPDFARNSFFYVYWTASEGDTSVNRIERYRLSADRASATRDRLILNGIPATRIHDGGRLRFGPDGMLYVGTGDARVPESAQDPSSLAGKILRLTPDGAPAPDNPRSGSAVYASGLRNPQGLAWLDERTMLIADHGPSGEFRNRTGGDELNLARKGDNLGWPTHWKCEEAAGFTRPLLAWDDANPPGGVAFHRGAIFVTTLGSRNLQRFVLNSERTAVQTHEVYFDGAPPAGFGRLRDIIVGPDGNLYITTSNCDGRGSCPADRDAILRVRVP